MGDRGNVIFNDCDGAFGYYTHWSGSDLKGMVARILLDNPGVKRRLEMGDYAYGYRGVIHGLLLEEYPDGVDETGGGIFSGTNLPDGDVKVTFLSSGEIVAEGLHFTIDEFISKYA